MLYVEQSQKREGFIKEKRKKDQMTLSKKRLMKIKAVLQWIRVKK